MPRRPTVLASVLVATAVLAGCSTDDDAGAAGEVAAAEPGAHGVALVSATDAADLVADPPADLVVLDVRTREEYDAGHIDGATVIDIREDDFAERIAGLDRDVPYLVYCRTGNRSAVATAFMSELGFTDVTEIADGTVGWVNAGLPLTTG